jgi:hypothetical protein
MCAIPWRALLEWSPEVPKAQAKPGKHERAAANVEVGARAGDANRAKKTNSVDVSRPERQVTDSANSKKAMGRAVGSTCRLNPKAKYQHS